MKIYLCRHGETEYNKNQLIMGHLPIPLNKTGQEQANVLANILKDKDIEVIYSSDLIRAQETTQVINSIIDVPVIYNENLREHSLGKYDGLSVTEFLERFEGVREFDELMQDIGGETTKSFINRVWKSFKEIIEKNKKKNNILIVTHGGCIRSIISKILDASEIIFDNLKQDNCNINIISYTEENEIGSFLIESVNDMCHFK